MNTELVILMLLLQGRTVQIFRNNLKKSKFHSGEIKNTLKYGSLSYHSVQNLLSFNCYLKYKK